MRPLLLLLNRDIHRLEYNPATQYRFHFISAWFWFACMVAVLFVRICIKDVFDVLNSQNSHDVRENGHVVPAAYCFQHLQ